jgi:hypothetical protein
MTVMMMMMMGKRQVNIIFFYLLLIQPDISSYWGGCWQQSINHVGNVNMLSRSYTRLFNTHFIFIYRSRSMPHCGPRRRRTIRSPSGIIISFFFIVVVALSLCLFPCLPPLIPFPILGHKTVWATVTHWYCRVILYTFTHSHRYHRRWRWWCKRATNVYII